MPETSEKPAQDDNATVEANEPLPSPIAYGFSPLDGAEEAVRRKRKRRRGEQT